MTSQFDAEFGQASGGVINAVSRQGTNDWHGSAFVFYKDSALTAKDIFVKQQNLEKPNTQEQQYGGTLGGPIFRDKAHFFGSIERVLQDAGVTINIPARPEFNSGEFERTKVWNFLTRFDHQINSAHTWGLRWLYESSPQFNQSSSNVTKAASQQETDTDYTIVGTLSSVFSPKMLNTFRIATTLEDVFFGNTQLFATGKRQEELPPTLNFQTFTHQQSSRHSRRIDRAWTGDEIFSWFVPDKAGSHDLKFGALYTYTPLRLIADGNMNGTFSFPGNLDFNRNDPRTYPERFSIRIGAQNILLKSHQVSWFIQDKWRINNRFTLSAGMRHETEIVPIPENDNPQFPDPTKYPVDKNNFAPRLGFSYVLDGSAQTILRGGYGRFYQTTPLTILDDFLVGGVFSDSFKTFPPNNADPGPSRGQFPTDPFLVNGPTVNRQLLATMFPAGATRRNTGTVNFDNPDRVQPYTEQVSIGFERQLWSDVSVSADYIRSWNRDLYMRINLNPGLRRTTSRTGTIDRVNPNFVTSVLQPVNTGRIEIDSLQTQIEKRFSNRFAIRGSYTLSKGRGNTEAGGAEQSSFQLLNDMRLDLNEGPTSVDRRHNLVLSGTVDVPWTGGMRLSGVARALSGAPFTIQDTNSDPDRNGILFDPLPPGAYSGNGRNAITVENVGGRGGAYGPGFFQFDLRAGYRFNLRETTKLEAFSEVFNLTNRANFNSPTGDRRSPNFLVPTSLRGNGPTRTAQFGIRLSF